MELTLWHILVLAVVQGATEFLPVSSSGHLVIVAAVLAPGRSPDELEVADLNIVLHAGTLLSILVYYWQRVWRLVGRDRRTAGLLAVGTVPAVLVGVPLKMFGEAVLASPLLAGVLLVATGGMLLAVPRQAGSGRYEQLSWGRALLIGTGQALAILPGLSRSGTTIVCGTRLGLAPNSAATFSFLLAIPAIGGACILQLVSGLGGARLPYWQLGVGAAVSFGVGLASLWLLVDWIQRGRLHYFAWWCIPLGIGVVVWQLLG